MNLRFGTGDYPKDVTDTWFEACDDGHERVIYVASCITVGGAIRGQCPVCAAMATASARIRDGVVEP